MSQLSLRAKQVLKQYSGFHRNPKTHLSHFVGIPMIVFSILGMLSKVTLGGQDAPTIGAFHAECALLLIAGSAIYYCYLDWKIGFSLSLFILGLYAAARPFPFLVHLALFIIGWLFQAWGHVKHEKNSPAFFTNLHHLLVGPLWVFSRLTRWE